MSAKIPPSERIRQLLEGYLQGGYQHSEQPASEFLKLAAQMVAQEALEQEVTDFLGRERYERQEEAVGYRNGYKPGRMRSAEGEIELSVPQVRETEQPYRSRLMEFFKGNTDVLDDLEASLAFLRCPITHHRRIRTTNLIERAFAEQRRRTNIDRNEFTRLTRRALSHLPNLPRLAASPLTELGIVTACVDEDADTLQRAHALRRILVESINELRPVDRGEYGTTDTARPTNGVSSTSCTTRMSQGSAPIGVP